MRAACSRSSSQSSIIAALRIAAIGLAHVAYHNIPGLAKLFLLEPFRLNLTLVAAILTIMSYSMIDTIVVFDRIRENRGKFGLVSKKTINDAINQTLSRTIITGVTAIFALAVLAILGGSSLFAFSVALIFGIVFGTYSSIYVGAPIILLWGVKRGEEEAKPLKPQTVR